MESHTRITLSQADLARMSPGDLNALLLRATKIEGTAVVRRADGSIKYDQPELAGSYGEQFLKEDKTDG